MVLKWIFLLYAGCWRYCSSQSSPQNISHSHIFIALDEASHLPHFWEAGVGSGNAELTSRMDWRLHMKQAHEELGFQYVRYHGVFNDRYLYFNAPKNKNKPSYFDAISTYSYLISIGVKPVIELSFTPSPVNSGKCTHFYYASCETVPTDFDEYAEIVKEFTSAMVSYFGIEEVKLWYFEVYNEADLHWKFEDYFKLYRAASLAVTSVDASLKVGGPASAFPIWISQLISACKNESIPLSFVSSHAYPTSGGAKPSEVKGLMTQVSRARKNAQNMPLFITEWNGVVDSRGKWHDEPDQAAFIVSALSNVAKNVQPLPQMFAYWAVSDVFIEQGLPSESVAFHGGFGLLNLYGVPKPAYRAFELLRNAGDLILSSESSRNSRLAIFPLYSEKTKMLRLFLANNGYIGENVPTAASNILLHSKRSCSITGSSIEGHIWRIDKENTNPLKLWRDYYRSPNYPKPDVIQALKKESLLRSKTVELRVHSNTSGCFIETEINIPAFGLAALDVNTHLLNDAEFAISQLL